MKRYIQRVLLLATVVAMLGTGVPAGADEVSIVCQTTKGTADGASSAQCAALGESMVQECDAVSPCSLIVDEGTELGRTAAMLVRDMGACRETPGATGECTLIDSGSANPAARVEIKFSYRCCPREWNIEIIIDF